MPNLTHKLLHRLHKEMDNVREPWHPLPWGRAGLLRGQTPEVLEGLFEALVGQVVHVHRHPAGMVVVLPIDARSLIE